MQQTTHDEVSLFFWGLNFDSRNHSVHVLKYRILLSFIDGAAQAPPLQNLLSGDGSLSRSNTFHTLSRQAPSEAGKK